MLFRSMKELDVRYIPTANQIADLLTKPLGISRFVILRSKLVLASTTSSLRGDVRYHQANIHQLGDMNSEENIGDSSLIHVNGIHIQL